MAKTPSPVADTSKYVNHSRKKIDKNFDQRVKLSDKIPWTDKQKELFKIIDDKNNKVILVRGPAGTSKTLVSVKAALDFLRERRVTDIIFVRSAVESASNSLGYLPGDLTQKFDNYVTPFKDKMSELLSQEAITLLSKDKRFKMCPINFVRGLSWDEKFIVLDEAQNLTKEELTTLLTRVGNFSKIVLCGDVEQSDLPEKKAGGFEAIWNLFADKESRNMGIVSFEFTEEDILRSDLCKFLVKKLRLLKKKDEFVPKAS